MIRKASRGEVIFCEGQPGNCAFIIEKGRIELSILLDGKPTIICALDEGAIFGEMALIGDQLRTATAIAADDVELLVIPEKYFKERLNCSDNFISLLLKVVLQRYFEMRIRLDGLLGNHDSAAKMLVEDNLLPEYQLDTVAAARQLEAENDLKTALDQGQLELFYQPIMDLKAHSVAGCESLIRWRHPERGLIPPIEFIGLAEASNLIIPIGFWIIQQAVQASARFVVQNADFKFVGINLSGKQFAPGDLIEHINQVFGQFKIRPETIKFEITESILMDNPIEIASSLEALKEMGSSIAIDDFGTGYSSFSYLHRFPIDTLKIDKCFVSTMLENTKSYQIVNSLCILAKAIGLNIVAEGVESEQEHQLLCEMGVDYGQGFLYAKPMPESEFLAFLSNH